LGETPPAMVACNPARADRRPPSNPPTGVALSIARSRAISAPQSLGRLAGSFCPRSRTPVRERRPRNSRFAPRFPIAFRRSETGVSRSALPNRSSGARHDASGRLGSFLTQ
jgi:hypothetical protein